MGAGSPATIGVPASDVGSSGDRQVFVAWADGKRSRNALDQQVCKLHDYPVYL